MGVAERSNKRGLSRDLIRLGRGPGKVGIGDVSCLERPDDEGDDHEERQGQHGGPGGERDGDAMRQQGLGADGAGVTEAKMVTRIPRPSDPPS